MMDTSSDLWCLGNCSWWQSNHVYNQSRRCKCLRRWIKHRDVILIRRPSGMHGNYSQNLTHLLLLLFFVIHIPFNHFTFIADWCGTDRVKDHLSDAALSLRTVLRHIDIVPLPIVYLPLGEKTVFATVILLIHAEDSFTGLSLLASAICYRARR